MRILTFFLFISAAVAAQTDKIDDTVYYIGELRTMQEVDLELTRVASTYTVRYKDVKKSRRFTKYNSFSFEKETMNLDSLYTTILEGFELMPEDQLQVPLGEEHLELDYTKSGGSENVRFIHYPSDSPKKKGTTVWMTKTRIRKLFGKG